MSSELERAACSAAWANATARELDTRHRAAARAFVDALAAAYANGAVVYAEFEVDLEPAMVTGRLDRDVVRRALRRHLAHIRYCYEKRLLAAPTLAGTLLLRFDVDAAGAASAASATGLDDEVASCVVAVIQRPDFVVGAGPGGAEIALRFRQR